MRLGFCGVGQMGRGMAARLLDSGYELRVWNRSPDAVEALRARGAMAAEGPGQLLESDIVITMLADDAAMNAVWIESGLVQQVGPSTIHLNMASVSLSMAQKLAGLHRAAGAQYVAAPVFGRPEAAASGQLDIVAAGAETAIACCAPLFAVLGRRWFNAGTEPHQANIVKIARNYLLGTIIQSLGEAFVLVERSGVAPATFLDIITSTSMNAPAYRNYGKFILEEPARPTFPLRLGLKDVELAVEAGRESRVSLPLAELLLSEHRAAIDGGYGEREWASLARFIAERSGSSIDAR